MKTLRLLLLVGVLGLLVPMESHGNGLSARTGDRVGMLKNRDYRCRVVQRGSAPISAVLEDAVAYALDIPLAMLSPLTSLIEPCEEETDLRTKKVSARRGQK